MRQDLLTLSERHMRRPIILATVAVTLVAAAYLPILDAPFFTDDYIYVVDNPTLHSIPLHKPWRFFSERTNPFEFLPVRDLSYRIDWALFGLAPWGYRIHNLILYAACCLLIWLCTFTMGRIFLAPEETDRHIQNHLPAWVAMIAAALFVAHPVHVESVAWISGRKDLLSGFFALAALWFFLLAIRSRPALMKFLLVSAILFALGILSKVTVLPLAAIAFLLVYGTQNKNSDLPRRLWKAVVTALPLLLVAVGALALHISIAADTRILEAPARESGISSVLSEAAKILGYLTRIALFPVHLRLIYDLNEGGFQEIAAWVLAGGAVAAGIGGLWLFLKRCSLPGLGMMIFVLFCLPFLQLIPFRTWSPVTERFLFLPVFGLSLAVGAVTVHSSYRLVHGVCLLIFLLLFWGSFQRAMEWKSPTTLATAVYRYSPHDSTAVEWYVYGMLSQKRYEEALGATSGLRDPAYQRFLAAYIEASAAANANDIPGATSLIKNMLQTMSKRHYSEFPNTLRLRIADLALETNALEEAGILYSSLLNASPFTADSLSPDIRSAIRYNYGLTLMKMGEKEEAAKNIRLAIDEGIGHGDAWNNLALLYRDLGQLSEAESAFLSGLKNDTEEWHAAYNLARLYLWQGKITKGKQMLLLAKRRATVAGDDPSPVLELIHQAESLGHDRKADDPNPQAE